MKKRRKTFMEVEQVKVSKTMMEALAKDLMEGHKSKAYNLDYWPAAREVVVAFYKEEK